MYFFRKFTACSLAAAMAAASACFQTVSAEDNADKFRVSFINFEGEVFAEQYVAAGEKIDYDAVDTSVLTSTVGNKNTKIRFYDWEIHPDTTDSDISIQALSETITLTVDSLPKRTEFYAKSGSIPLDGLTGTIRSVVRLGNEEHKRNNDGDAVIEIDINLGCHTSPSDLSAAFMSGDTATVYIYPPDYEKPIASYKISYFDGLGDIDGDDTVNSVDATCALRQYTAVASGGASLLDESRMLYGDTDRNGSITPVDATNILKYYTSKAANSSYNWENLFQKTEPSAN